MYSLDEDVPNDLISEDIYRIIEYYLSFISSVKIDIKAFEEEFDEDGLGKLVRNNHMVKVTVTESLKDGPGVMEFNDFELGDRDSFNAKAVILIKYLGVLDNGADVLRHNTMTRLRFLKDAEGKLTKREGLEVGTTAFKHKLTESSLDSKKDLQTFSILAGFDNCMTAKSNYRQYHAEIALQNLFDPEEDNKVYTTLCQLREYT